MRHHQSPRAERHEFPGEEECERVVGNNDKRHAGEKRRIERQHASRRRFVLAIAEREQTSAQRAEIDHDKEEGRECIEPEMRAEPRHADRQGEAFRRSPAEKVHRRRSERNRRDNHARAVNNTARGGGTSDGDRKSRECEQGSGAGKDDRERHGGGLLRRTPRPPIWLVALSAISSMPSVSSAATSFISESTLPRITPPLASMRWMVGNDKPADSASVRWSIPRSAREALSWPAVIMEYH